MATEDLSAVECKISRGGFSSERVFRIALSNGEHIGLAPVEYCYTRQGGPIGDQAPSRATPIDGLVAARVLEREPGGKVLIYVPDGEVLSVDATLIHSNGKGSPHVSVQP